MMMKTSPGYCFTEVLLKVYGTVPNVQLGPLILERQTVALVIFILVF